jgi:hypothetical protein
LGGKFWKSFQRRRELLLKSKFRGFSIYGWKDDKATLEAVELPIRNSVPHEWDAISANAGTVRSRRASRVEALLFRLRAHISRPRFFGVVSRHG